MRRSNLLIVGILLLLILPACSISTLSQDDASFSWDPSYKEWAYREEIILPIPTNKTTARYQPIDLRFRFEQPCWTENENNTSIRISCWHGREWNHLDSQIYSLEKETGKNSYINACNVIFLVPNFADGTERYFLYYNDEKTSKPNYPDHVFIEDLNYTSSPLPELSAQASFYGITQDGYCIYGVGQQGQLLDRSCAQVVVKQKKGTQKFDLTNADQIVSFAFSYYYGSKEKDESSSDQVFIDKKIFVDGNLMVEFGIISESAKKDVQTTAIYRYYYCPLEDKRINVHVKHEMLKDATVQGIDNIDGRFGSLISLKTRSAAIESLNFGEIYPFVDYYSKNENIAQYQLNQNPSSKQREWVISYKNDASLGSEAWLSYGDGKTGKAEAVLFAANKGIVVSGTDENDGIQIKVAEKEYLNFLGTEIDYVSINFGRRSYQPGDSHDVTIPSDLIVQFDAEVYTTDTGGYETVQSESEFYRTLIKSRTLSGEVPFEREQKRYNLTILPKFGGIRLTHPWLSNRTGNLFPVMWIELHRDGQLIAAGEAERFLFARSKITFFDVLEGNYLVKVFLKTTRKKMFTGSAMLLLSKDTKLRVPCTWEREITFTFHDQHGRGIPGISASLTNKDGVVYDMNTSNTNGELIVKAPYDRKEPYTLQAEYHEFIIYNAGLQNTIKRLDKEVVVDLFTFNVLVTDKLKFPPGIEVTPILIVTNGNKTLRITPRETGNGRFTFEDIPAGEYHLQMSYGEFIDDMHISIPDSNDTIHMEFSALFEMTIDLFDSKGNTLVNNDIEFIILRDNKIVNKTNAKTVTLPPASYTIDAYLNNALIGVKNVELTNDKHITFVTTIESLFPLVLSLLLYSLFGFFVLLTLLKKFSLSSLMKCLAILLVIFSLFQPWWLFSGKSQTEPIEKTTAIYINPGMMIETEKYYGEVTLTLAELPDIFLMFLMVMSPLAILACICLGAGVALRRTSKKNYAFLLSICGIVLLGILVPSFYIGTSRLIEASIGPVQGQGLLTISMGLEDVLVQANWGFGIGFYFVGIAIFIAVFALFLDIRQTLKQKKRLL
jgi:hypothetical protein